ncbi:hypothetical protein CF95_gp199 [Erwinia phage PhiEaH1]|uniref:Glycine-rich domain-containing protein n=1 Tax=Erwinia phage PhiEaH1 TaxID=1401669 RepID=W8CZQ1_9CAUD|nr:hypothetical protein CF95_gp199 [Erwinia phage PhiEaH1]AGX01921.1 hypothetical protein [Erwinia phage PhiEaH1]
MAALPSGSAVILLCFEARMLEMVMGGKKKVEVLPSQAMWVAAGTFNWVVPDGVKSISAVAIGAGAHGAYGTFDGVTTTVGGVGGSLRYNNAISVTPGETLTIIVGAGTSNLGYTTGGIGWVDGKDTSILRGSTVLLKASGGRATKDAMVANSLGAGGGDGGVRIATSSTQGAPGSGTGGYYGDGGGTTAGATPTDTTAGKAGTMTSNTVNGVNISGGNNGIGSQLYGTLVKGTRCGVSAGVARRSSDNARAYAGAGVGGVRIMWGDTRAFPENADDV